MPLVTFDSLPDDSRVWVFAADPPLQDAGAEQLLDDVERFLKGWQAHGEPLRTGYDWRESRFLTIAVDQSTAGASGCSIDGLYRTLRALEPVLGASLVAGGRIFYREPSGAVAAVSRETFGDLASAGAIRRTTPVFDTTLTALGEWRRKFERPLAESWHAQLMPASR
jgi:hypothetical protein